VEGCNGIGRHIAHRLVHDGETVVDVPPKLSAQVRVFATGSQERHRLSRAGNRRINRVLHIMAIVQLRNQTQGRACYDARKAAGMPSMMAMRALKRRLSNVVFARMLADQQRREEAGPGGQPGTTTDSSVTDLTPDIGSSEKPHPGPATHLRPATRAAH